MSENPPEQSSEQLISLIKESYDKEIKRLEDKIDAAQEHANTKTKEIIDRIDTGNEGVNNKLEEIDVAFRGNSRIGVFEQLRSMRRSMKINTKVIYVCLILLAGSKLFGSSINEWWQDFRQEWIGTKQVEYLRGGESND